MSLARYVRFDEHELWVHRDYSNVFRQLNWLTAGDVLEGTWQAAILRRRNETGGWDNTRLEIPCRIPDGISMPVFMKRHRDSEGVMPAGLREAEAVNWCEEAGVPCLTMIAAGVCSTPVISPEGCAFSSVFMSAAIGSGHSAFDELTVAAKSIEIDRRKTVESWLGKVAHVVAGLHSADLFHGDCHLQHFLVDPEQTGSDAGLRLIDLQGIQRVTQKQGYYLWLKDMAQLRYSLLKLGLYKDFAENWYDLYWSHVTSGALRQRNTMLSRKLIDCRGDLRIVKRLTASLAALQFKRVVSLLRTRFHAAS